ncbi:YceD family protein [Sodalinema gerasimenkoae]|uniref:YceD family protein n=1 Tax=Sodalinema gerasimenkoae TaxID=2862348 RepID=UPI00135C2508|nr:YceD family protein [Sodalinema gerasimenkoae]
MESIYVPSLLKAPQKTEVIDFKQFIPELETLMPVRGTVSVAHEGTYLQISATLEAIVTLTCDRCLQQYNHRLNISPEEVIWLDVNAGRVDDLPLEQEVLSEELTESLHPEGHFDPQDWVYEQLCLALPHRKLCRQDCGGIDVETATPPIIDRRWAALQDLKGKLPSEPTR